MAHTQVVTDFLGEQSAGSVLRSTFRIFFRHYPVLAAIYLAPILPFVLLQALGDNSERYDLFLLGAGLTLLFSLFSMVAVTLAVSDICRGNAPRLLRSFRRMFSPAILKGLPSYLLAVVCIYASLLFFVVPGLFVLSWLLFVLPIVVIEEVSGTRALSRSKILGVGWYARNLGVVFFSFVLAFVFNYAVVLSLMIPAVTEGFEWLLYLSWIVSHSFYPLYVIAGVLLYYDMRVRKELVHLSGFLQDIPI